MDNDEYDFATAIEAYSAPPHLQQSSHILEAAEAETKFLIEGVIPERAISFIVGAPGSSKSWLAYDLAIRVARGEPWLGRANTHGPRTAMVLSYDNPPVECGRRFLRLGLTTGDHILFHAPDHTERLLIQRATAPNEIGSIDILRGLIEQHRPAVVIVDSFRQAHTRDENSSNEMMTIMSDLKRWLSGGASVVIVHHSATGSDGEIKARGSSEITASADTIITVNSGKARWIKSRSWYMPAAQAQIEFEVVDQGDQTVVRAVDASSKPEVLAAVRDALDADPALNVVALARQLKIRTQEASRAKRQIKKERFG